MFVICLGRIERIVEDGRKDASRKDENTDGDRASISCVDFVVPIDAIVIKFAGRNFSIACRLGRLWIGDIAFLRIIWEES